MSLLGVGKVPFSMVLMLLVLSWGLIGVIVNRLLWPIMPVEWLLPLVAVPVAAVGSALLTSAAARGMARIMPLDESTAVSRREMVGRLGEALYDINETFGMMIVKDDRGERYQLPCRTGPGAPVIGKGQPVLLVHYDQEKEQFIVRPYELDAPGGQTDAPEVMPQPSVAQDRRALGQSEQ